MVSLRFDSTFIFIEASGHHKAAVEKQKVALIARGAILQVRPALNKKSPTSTGGRFALNRGGGVSPNSFTNAVLCSSPRAAYDF
jgi:hypothetical protein